MSKKELFKKRFFINIRFYDDLKLKENDEEEIYFNEENEETILGENKDSEYTGIQDY